MSWPNYSLQGSQGSVKQISDMGKPGLHFLIDTITLSHTLEKLK